jgi:hypothetical protein
MRVLAAVPAVLLALAPALAGQTGGGSAVKADAGELEAAYLTNEAFADRAYTGKVVELTGKMQRIYRTFAKTVGRAYILELESKEGGVEFYLCFPEHEQGRLARLRKSQPVTIRGRCLGVTREKAKESDPGLPRITFTGCQVVSGPEPPE